MKNPTEPVEIFYIFIGLVAAILTGLHEYITNPYAPYMKTIFSIGVSILFIWLIRYSITDYKGKLNLAKRCTNKDIANIKYIEIESRQGSSSHNSDFMILEFNGYEQKFTNITDDIRIKYSKEKELPIFFNPLNIIEFVYDNTALKSL